MKDLEAWVRMVEGLHAKWQAHDGQIPIGDAVFNRNIDSIFLQCGRKFGKTEWAIYMQWRLAKMFPHTPHYFIAPHSNQIKEILWANQRAQSFGPRAWLKEGSRGINNSEMRLNFTNGSFIKFDGSNNFDNKRGLEFKSCVYEEFKDHNPQFRKAMRANASVMQGLELFMGSPPAESEPKVKDNPDAQSEADYSESSDYVIIAQEHRIDPRKFFIHRPSWTNPHISKEWLWREKKALYLRGDGDEWEREYAARIVRGGKALIFPMYDPNKMKKPHAEIIESISRDKNKLSWYWWADPAGSSCFAVLFVAINPYTKKIYVLDEIYERDQRQMTTLCIGERILEIKKELNPKKNWRQGYDEAASWFNNEWISHFPHEGGLEPSHKATNNKHVGLTVMKDAFLQDKIEISDRCKWFSWELENYAKDKNGKIPKKNDHLNDDFRYIISAEAYELTPGEEYLEALDENFRGASMESEFETEDEFEEF